MKMIPGGVHKSLSYSCGGEFFDDFHSDQKNMDEMISYK